MHLDYVNFTSKTKALLSSDKVLIYAINQETGGLGEILYNQDPSEGASVNYIENLGKIYIWEGAVPQNWEGFAEVLSGYDIALRSERSNTRYVLFDEANDSLTKEVCRKVGVPYVSKAEENLATAEALKL